MLQEALFLLLPLAALSGWLIGRRRRRTPKTGSEDCNSLSKDYFKGLNYLLNDQSDKALEVFVQMSEFDSDTVELHFALASLFSRRGEVDRAIRIHQNLIARPMLASYDRNRALYELALDYMRAGLLDRAENLFTELSDDTEFGQQSRRQLLDVYQQEKDWDRAIQIARRLDHIKGQPLAPILAHFYCEQAELLLAGGDSSQAMKLVKRAFNEDRDSVRATLLEARLHLLNQNPRAAIKSLKRVEKQNKNYLSLIIGPLQQAYEQMDKLEQYVAYLKEFPEQGSSSALLSLSEQVARREGEQEALALLGRSLQQHSSLRLLERQLELKSKHGPDNSWLVQAHDILHNFLADKPVFLCDGCGYHSKTMLWQCPSCKQWDRIKPIHGIEGE